MRVPTARATPAAPWKRGASVAAQCLDFTKHLRSGMDFRAASFAVRGRSCLDFCGVHLRPIPLTTEAAMFERLDRVPDDPILGLMAAFRADSDPKKVDLGVGVFRDAKGDTPVLDCVRKAERLVLERQTSKTYVAPAGNAAFNQAMEKLVFGAGHGVLAAERVRSIQGPGGCGALRLGAELVRLAAPQATVHVSTPTWANHVPLLTGSGLKLA